MTKLFTEIKQSKPFASKEEEVFLNLQRTAELLWWGVAETLKTLDLSPTQYNALRILRGAGSGGLACREIGERMVTKDSDITRLLDRLEARELVSRAREQKDRRVITARITSDGLRILKELDRPMIECHRRQLGHLSQQQQETLCDLLDLVRSRPEGV